MTADFAHALDGGQGAYRDAAGGDVEAHTVAYEMPMEIVCSCGTNLSVYGLTRSKASVFAEHLRTVRANRHITRQATAAAIRAEADRICNERGCHVAGNDHAELMKWAGVFAGVVERGES